MPRTYVRKKPLVEYDAKDIEHAVNDIISKKKTYRQCEAYYGIPKSVIFNRIKGRKTPLKTIGSGRTSAIPIETENEIIRCVVTRSEMGIPCDKKELRKLVGDYVQVSGLKTPFKDNIPGEDWYFGFMKRHPNLSLKKPEHLQKLRKDGINPEVVFDFYDKLQKVIEENNLTDKPQYVFNADEIVFHHNPSRIHALGFKGKALSSISGGSGRESTTVLACVSADGSILPPLIIFEGAAVQARWTYEDGFPGTLYASSANGWMEEPQFFSWLSDGFIPFVENLRDRHGDPEQAALLVYDGNCSHISVQIVEKALQNNVVLIRLPSHLTDKMQPLDKCVFGPVKTAWERKLIAYGKLQIGKGRMRMAKHVFSQHIGEIWKESMSRGNIISGFSSTGIFPVNRTKFPHDEFSSQALERCRAQPTASHVHVESATFNEMTSKNVEGYIDTNQPNDERLTENNMSLSNSIQAPSISAQQYVKAAHRSSHISDLFFHSPSSSKIIKPSVEPKKPVPRLKKMRYGEVFSSNEVLKRLKEPEAKKIANKTPKPKRKFVIETKKPLPKKRRTKSTSSEDSANEKDVAYEDNSSWNEEFKADNANEKEELEPADPARFRKGQFLLIQFKGGLRLTILFKYVCVIQSYRQNGEIEVMLLKSLDTLKKTFSLQPSETKMIRFEDIIGILPDPSLKMLGTRIHYKFETAIDTNEK